MLSYAFAGKQNWRIKKNAGQPYLLDAEDSILQYGLCVCSMAFSASQRRLSSAIYVQRVFFEFEPRLWIAYAHVYVSIFTSVTGPCEEVSQRIPRYFSNLLSKPDLQHTIGCHATNFTLGHWGWTKNPWRDIPGPYQALYQLALTRIEPAIPT